MKKLAIVIAAAACVCTCALALFGCSSASVTSAKYVVGDATVEVVGKALEITVEGNPTTGYEWTAEIEGDTLKLEDSSYKSSGSGTTTGAGGTYTFTYKGVKGGTSTINFTYARSWEKTSADKTMTVTVTTDGDGTITATETKRSDGTSGTSKK